MIKPTLDYFFYKIIINNRLNKQKIYKEGLKRLNKFDILFNTSDLERKRQLIGSMFPEKFQFEKNKVRTADINPILLKIASINKGFKGNKKGTNQIILICPSLS